jgi:hypothetical protein
MFPTVPPYMVATSLDYRTAQVQKTEADPISRTKVGAQSGTPSKVGGQSGTTSKVGGHSVTTSQVAGHSGTTSKVAGQTLYS